MGSAVFKNGGRRKSAPEVRTEQVLVTVRKAARDSQDLTGLCGVLTIDYLDGVADEVTFDPDDETVPNAILPVQSLLRSGEDAGRITLRTEDGHLWTFEETDDYDDGLVGDDYDGDGDGDGDDEDEEEASED